MRWGSQVLSSSSGAGFGMLVVETIARIRRAHLVDGKSIKAICRELKISRKVVRKVLRIVVHIQGGDADHDDQQRVE
jgi:hypothetical protein